jgi:hypothetical protein
MLKSSSFFPVFSAAASHRGFRPRPAHVSAGYFTVPVDIKALQSK